MLTLAIFKNKHSRVILVQGQSYSTGGQKEINLYGKERAWEKVTVRTLQERKKKNVKITCVTAYDQWSAKICDEANIDMILIGDSAAMVVWGHKSTTSITMDEMIHHCKAVSRAVQRPFLIGDLPFGAYNTVDLALENATRLIKEGGVDAIKLEGGRRILPQVKALIDSGFAVIGHIGLTPQSEAQLGGLRLQGQNSSDVDRILDDAKVLSEAGVAAIVIEVVPRALAAQITDAISVPTIGIGAGVDTSGQVMVFHDIVGLHPKEQKSPKFVKEYLQSFTLMKEAIELFRKEVINTAYPSDEYTYQPHGPKKGKSSATQAVVSGHKPVTSEGHKPKISVIVGGGSIGSLLASRLGTVSDIQSYVVTGWKEHADQIQASGLRTDQVEDGTNEVVNVNLIRTDSNMLQNLIDSKFCPDFIFITVKSGQNDSASATTKRLIENCQKENKPVHIVVIQNGVGMKRIGKLFEEDLKKNPNLHIVYGITKMGATIVSPGVIRPTGDGLTTLFSFDNEEATQAVANLLTSAKIKVEVAPKQDIDKVIWSKLLVNAVINPLGSILGVSNGELASHPPFQRLIQTLANEISKVAAQSPQIQLSYSPEDLYEQVQKVLSATKDNMNSMVADLRRDEATEFCDINGALINLIGQDKANSMMPLHQAITTIMKIMSPKSFSFLPQSQNYDEASKNEESKTNASLQICDTIQEVREMRQNISNKNLTIGFVPTMGALHSGHLALVAAAKKQCDKVIVSIFVNPTQFGPHEDLTRYPRPIENDIKLLKEIGTDFLFLPSVEEMYPQSQNVFVDPLNLNETLEGQARPGHFRGVCTVVMKLFNIVQPHKAYFGQKDAVQVIAIKNMVDQLNVSVEVVCEPTLRELTGLAMSSRNVYLSQNDREEVAPIIYSALKKVEKFIINNNDKKFEVKELRSIFENSLTHPSLKIEYVSFSNFLTALDYKENEILTSNNCSKLLVSVAVKLGNTRLIDNIVIDMTKKSTNNISNE